MTRHYKYLLGCVLSARRTDSVLFWITIWFGNWNVLCIGLCLLSLGPGSLIYICYTMPYLLWFRISLEMTLDTYSTRVTLKFRDENVHCYDNLCVEKFSPSLQLILIPFYNYTLPNNSAAFFDKVIRFFFITFSLNCHIS